MSDEQKSQADLERTVAAYVQLRDLIAQRDKARKEALKPLKSDLEKLENLLQARMQELGVESLRTKAGTAYLTKAQSTKVEDWEAALRYIVENEAFHLLERRIAKTPLLESGEQVPGVTIQTIHKTNVRRS